MMSQSHAPQRTPPMRIVYVAPFGLRHKTTVWARTLPLAQELVRRGHTATIVIPPWDSPEDAGRRADEAGVHLIHVALDGGLPATLARMLAVIDASAPEIVHIVKPRAHAGIVQFLLWQRRRLGRVPWKLVLDVDDWEQAWGPINRYPWPVARFLAWQETWGMRHADGFTAASHWLMEQLAQRAPDRPRLYLPNGVNAAPATGAPDLAAPTPRRDPSAPGILFFSRFIEVDPAWLAAFWQQVRAALPNARLLIAGAPVQPHLAPPFHAALEGQPGVEWLGYVPADQLPALYGRVACAIFPAAPVPLHQAKCSVRLATTLLHGVPVIASAVGEQAHYGADNIATLVPAGASPAEFAAATVDLIRHPDPQRVQRGQAELRRRYAWPLLAEQLERFYTSLTAGPSTELT